MAGARACFCLSKARGEVPPAEPEEAATDALRAELSALESAARAMLKCYNCGKDGHIGRDCKEDRTESYSQFLDQARRQREADAASRLGGAPRQSGGRMGGRGAPGAPRSSGTGRGRGRGRGGGSRSSVQ